MKTIHLLALAALGSAALAPRAHAHIGFVGDIKSRDDDAYGDAQKEVPCDGKRGDGPIYTFEPGTTIKLSIVEAIPHPGYYRIAFDTDGEDFVDPRSIDPIDKARGCPINDKDQCGQSDFCNTPEVLLDRLNPHTITSGPVTWNIKLPDVECDNCVLQMLQVMEDDLAHGAYCPTDTCSDTSLEDVYHRCVDIKLKKGAKNSKGATTEPPTNQESLCPMANTKGGVEIVAEDDAGASAPPTATGSDAGTAAEVAPDASVKDASVAVIDASIKQEVSSASDGQSSSSGGGCALGSRSEGAAWSLLALGLLLARRRRYS